MIRNHRVTMIVVMLLVIGLGSAAAGGETMDFAELMRSRQWVTAFLGTSRPDLVPSPADRITVRVGGEQRILYEARGDDFALSVPILSRDASRLVFTKMEGRGTSFREYIYAMNVEGGVPRRIVEVGTGPTPRGAEIGVSAAWSHDTTKVAYHGLFPGESASPPVPYRDRLFGAAFGAVGGPLYGGLGGGWKGAVGTGAILGGAFGG
jgi:hypothetical protein